MDTPRRPDLPLQFFEDLVDHLAEEERQTERLIDAHARGDNKTTKQILDWLVRKRQLLSGGADAV